MDLKCLKKIAEMDLKLEQEIAIEEKQIELKNAKKEAISEKDMAIFNRAKQIYYEQFKNQYYLASSNIPSLRVSGLNE